MGRGPSRWMALRLSPNGLVVCTPNTLASPHYHIVTSEARFLPLQTALARQTCRARRSVATRYLSGSRTLCPLQSRIWKKARRQTRLASERAKLLIYCEVPYGDTRCLNPLSWQSRPRSRWTFWCSSTSRLQAKFARPYPLCRFCKSRLSTTSSIPTANFLVLALAPLPNVICLAQCL